MQFLSNFIIAALYEMLKKYRKGKKISRRGGFFGEINEPRLLEKCGELRLKLTNNPKLQAF